MDKNRRQRKKEREFRALAHLSLSTPLDASGMAVFIILHNKQYRMELFVTLEP